MASTTLRICIFGTGAVGTVYAYILSKILPPKDIVCICRSNYRAASKSGFNLNSTIFGHDLIFHPTIVSSIDEATQHGPFNYLLISSKSLPTVPSTPEMLRPLITKDTAIALLQNGISIEPPYSTLYPDNPLLSCVVYLPATSTSPAVVAHKEVEHLHIGTYPGEASEPHKAAARTLITMLTSGGATATLHDDIQSQRWSKLVVNASWNPICAISRSRDAEFLHSSGEASTYIRDVMLEIAAIAQAAGYADINEKLVDYQLGRAQARPLPGVEPSMLADALAGRALEVDAIVGNALVIAKEKGLQVPLLNGVFRLVKALDGSLGRARDLEKQ